MILLFSNSFEPTTNVVIDWLLHYQKKVIRVNLDDGNMADFHLVSKKKDESAEVQVDFHFTYNGKTVRFSDIEGYWFRRGGMPPLRSVFDLTAIFKFRFQRLFRQQLNQEMRALNEYIFYLLGKVPVRIGGPRLADVNKMIVLDQAAAAGLLVPDSYITSTCSGMTAFLNEQDEYITKPLVGLMLQGNSERYFCYTERITPTEVTDFPDELFPSLLQDNIPKLFEIRSFFLHGHFYSMAIFSQNDSQTQCDFRKYNYDVPNRTTPYQLPVAIEEKLKLLLDRLGLDTGSIDMIYTPDKKYVFLEVNPVGQFGMVSSPCNYYLEKKVASYLANQTIN